MREPPPKKGETKLNGVIQRKFKWTRKTEQQRIRNNDSFIWGKSDPKT